MADEIADENNPLTARVMVNRVWGHLFGKPLVNTPSDFGVRTPPPANPAILDYLADYFMRHEWSVKALVRHIMVSSVYRQSSDDNQEVAMIDPENELCWKMNRKRLTFEAMRDSLLKASGNLDQKIGGQPVDIIKPNKVGRRSIYGFIDRQNLANVFRTFDFANPDSHCPERHETTVPQQALYMMNNPFIQMQSASLVGQTSLVPDSRFRITALYRSVLARDPSEDEVELALDYLKKEKNSAAAWQSYAQALLCSNEFAFVD